MKDMFTINNIDAVHKATLQYQKGVGFLNAFMADRGYMRVRYTTGSDVMAFLHLSAKPTLTTSVYVSPNLLFSTRETTAEFMLCLDANENFVLVATKLIQEAKTKLTEYWDDSTASYYLHPDDIKELDLEMLEV